MARDYVSHCMVLLHQNFSLMHVSLWEWAVGGVDLAVGADLGGFLG